MTTTELPHLRMISGVQFGKNVKVFPFTNLYGCQIGDNVKIGAFVEIQKGVRIGHRCKISSHTFICQGVVIEDDVFIAHNVTFINDRHPRATNPNGTMQTEEDWECVPTIIKNGSTIGSSCTVMCGVTIGKYAMVGAGSVVTRDVPDYSVVAGNPAVPIVSRRSPEGR